MQLLKDLVEELLAHELKLYPGLKVYLLSLEGEVAARGSGHWRLELHLEDESSVTGVIHRLLGESHSLSHDEAEFFRGWLGQKSADLKSIHPPRIDIGVAV